ncbi:hypothetical protein H6P81_018288 [Aristolochia fimbriata]|uniref:Integrase zinc-binding domain-containing protein n=1 Tax=Aristolochia fimbriata TaxID=158543 RepID=A0AAV7E2I1_ARIFI|nr:hypothetical protein H6P81_018288 [Aristolochia fimbriata]
MGVNRGIPGRRNIPSRSASTLGDVFRWRQDEEMELAPESFSSLQRRIYRPYSFVLTQICSNNEAESTKPSSPDSQLTGEFEVKKLELEPLSEICGELPPKSRSFTPLRPSLENGPADALAGIAASLAHLNERPNRVPVCEQWVIPPPAEEETEEELTEEIEESLPISASQNQTEDWREPIINFLRHSTLPVDLRERVQIHRIAARYVLINDVLYRRSYEGVLHRCLSKQEGLQVLKEIHGGICGAHQAGPKLHLQVKRLGYYWPTMLRDAIEMARTCKPCQLHADYIHQPPVQLHPTVASWPFKAWGMDIIGPITPNPTPTRQVHLGCPTTSPNGLKPQPTERSKPPPSPISLNSTHIQIWSSRYIVDGQRHTLQKTESWTAFLRKISRYNGGCRRLTTRQPTDSREAFNKTLCKILKKMVGAHKRSWDEKLPEALWAYKMTIRTPTQSTPDSLVYGAEAVLPLEVQLPSLRIAVREGLTTEECVRLRLAELESLDEQRLEAQQ